MDVDGRIINILQEADVAIIVREPWGYSRTYAELMQQWGVPMH